MFKKDRNDFESKWDDVRVFIEYGMLTEEKFLIKPQILHFIKTQLVATNTLSNF